MMGKHKPKKIFISHSFEDRPKVDLLRAQLRSLKNVDALWADEFEATEKQIHAVINEQIDSSSMVLVYIGKNGFSERQIYEIERAQERNISVLGIVSPDRQYPDYDNPYHARAIPTINWSFDKLKRVLTGEEESLAYEDHGISRLESPIIKIDFEKISKELTKYLLKNPDGLYKLSPRKFEELVAYLMEKNGYEVSLTQQSKDGGIDIFALRKDDFGNFLTIVECKKYARSRPVGVGIVRSMYGVLNVENASHGIIATTSTFTSGANKMARQYKYQLSLKDHADIITWMKIQI